VRCKICTTFNSYSCKLVHFLGLKLNFSILNTRYLILVKLSLRQWITYTIQGVMESPIELFKINMA
jgi:hypothetical protein